MIILILTETFSNLGLWFSRVLLILPWEAIWNQCSIGMFYLAFRVFTVPRPKKEETTIFTSFEKPNSKTFSKIRFLGVTCSTEQIAVMLLPRTPGAAMLVSGVFGTSFLWCNEMGPKSPVISRVKKSPHIFWGEMTPSYDFLPCIGVRCPFITIGSGPFWGPDWFLGGVTSQRLVECKNDGK